MTKLTATLTTDRARSVMRQADNRVELRVAPRVWDLAQMLVTVWEDGKVILTVYGSDGKIDHEHTYDPVAGSVRTRTA